MPRASTSAAASPGCSRHQQRGPGVVGVAPVEERQPLDVVPVQVREQDRAAKARPFSSGVTAAGRCPRPGASVGAVVVVGRERDARGVAAVPDELRSRRRGRAADAAQLYPHRSSLPDRLRGGAPRPAPPERTASNCAADTDATRHAVTAISVDVRTPPSRCARSPSSAPGPYSASHSPSRSTRITPSRPGRCRCPARPGGPARAPAGSFVMTGLAAPCISCTDSECSSAVSTAVTSASESSSPHGRVRAEGLGHPVGVVGQARLVGERAVVVVDPVPGEPARPAHRALRRAVGVQRERQRRPHQRRLPLHVGRVSDLARGRQARPAADGLAEPHPAVAALGIPAQVRQERVLEHAPQPAEPDRGVADVAAPAVAASVI